MESRQKKRLGDMLIEEQIITDEQLSDALEKKKGTTKRLGEVLVELGYTNETDIAKALSSQLGLEIVSLSGIQIEENVLKLVDVAVLRKYVMVPIGFSPNNMNEVRVAMADPMDMRGIDDFSIITNLQVAPVIATTHDIMLTLDRFYGSSEARKVAEAYALERRQEEQREQEKENDEDIANSPIVLLVNAMIEQAARQRASDIHIEALESRVRIRYRIDGVLYEKASYDIRLLNAITARIKIIGGMDISEKRKPQDGRITLVVDRVEYDIRVSILPTVYGEKCVLRLAQKKALTKDKRELGFTPGELESFERMLKHPNGILLVTGPTGSGKSTTLYTALSELNTEDINIITVEDPVEANLDGVNQVQVNAKADMTFASALRSILRQDPDIIMIGEIRDEETAEIAVQASITGHLVVSTLHTNSAAGTITRMLNMGVEGYLLADSVIGVIAQRLVRRLCPNCKQPHKPTEYERKLLNLDDLDETMIFEAKGCPMCANTGYKGRIGVYEMMEISTEMKDAIAKDASTAEIKHLAVENGMETLAAGARRKVLEGITSVSELVGVSAED